MRTLYPPRLLFFLIGSLIPTTAYAKKVTKVVQVEEEEPRPAPESKTEITVGLRGGGTVFTGGGGVGHFSAFGGAALGGDHALLINGQLGAAFRGGAAALIGAAVGYRGYFGSLGSVRPGVMAVLEPELWVANGTVFLIGPTIAPLMKVGALQIAIPIGFRFGVASAPGISASSFAISPTLQVGYSF